MDVSVVVAADGTLSQRLGRRVRELRLGRGMTQVDLAELMGVHDSMVSKLEKREATFTVAQLERVAEVLGVDLVVEFRERAA